MTKPGEEANEEAKIWTLSGEKARMLNFEATEKGMKLVNKEKSNVTLI